tara:strand:- start:1339 stop:1674 length:336 start_codon:yes stop_codon:yes gene_type:complete
MTNAFQLDRRVQFCRSELVDDEFSQVEVWADYGTPVSAGKQEISDAERFAGGQVQATISTRFTVRWSTFTRDLTPKDCLICEGRDYNIIGIKETPDSRRRMLEITAMARAD